MIYKYCRRCGRLLKGEENRKRGFGETCFKKVQAGTGRKALVPLPLEVPHRETAETEQSESKAESRES